MLNGDSLKIISGRFSIEDQREIISGMEAYSKLLTETYKADATPDFLERISCAILKCSGSKVEKFRKAMFIAEQDWRDLLVAAGFANSTTIHLEWLKDALKKVENSQRNQKKSA